MEKLLILTRPISGDAFCSSKKDDSDGQSLRELMLSETSNTVGGLTNVLQWWPFQGFRLCGLRAYPYALCQSRPVRAIFLSSPVAFNVKEANRKEEKGSIFLNWMQLEGDLSQTFHPLESNDRFGLAEPFETLVSPEFYKEQPCQKAWFALILFNCIQS